MNNQIFILKTNTITISEQSTPSDIIKYAELLSEWDKRQLKKAFQLHHYEMATNFLWQRTMIHLKRQLAVLGMMFIGEILNRSYLKNNSIFEYILTDFDAVNLIVDLGFLSSSDNLPFLRAIENINHFSGSSFGINSNAMAYDEAISILKISVQTVLSSSNSQNAYLFQISNFRKKLQTESFLNQDLYLTELVNVPYFHLQTILRTLVSMVKISFGFKLQYVLENLNLILPLIWERLLAPEKSLIGLCYAEVRTNGKMTATQEVGNALLKVRGFDFVPETHRTQTFINVAQKIIDAHFKHDNFYTEPKLITFLEKLGTIIPEPAIATCMTALLCVRLGNRYGIAKDAQSSAKKIIEKLTLKQWSFYFNQCFPSDKNVLRELMHEKPANQFCELIAEFPSITSSLKNSKIISLINAGHQKNISLIQQRVKEVWDENSG